MSGQITLTPLDGLLSLGDQLARRYRLGEVWNGENGLRGVTQDVLKDAGVPLSVELSPRSVAEGAGIVKDRNKTRRRK